MAEGQKDAKAALIPPLSYLVCAAGVQRPKTGRLPILGQVNSLQFSKRKRNKAIVSYLATASVLDMDR